MHTPCAFAIVTLYTICIFKSPTLGEDFKVFKLNSNFWGWLETTNPTCVRQGLIKCLLSIYAQSLADTAESRCLFLSLCAEPHHPLDDSKWPFDPLVGGHLTPIQGHIKIPKRWPFWITRQKKFHDVSWIPIRWFFFKPWDEERRLKWCEITLRRGRGLNQFCWSTSPGCSFWCDWWFVNPARTEMCRTLCIVQRYFPYQLVTGILNQPATYLQDLDEASQLVQSSHRHQDQHPIILVMHALPMFNIAPENGWLEDDPFLLG